MTTEPNRVLGVALVSNEYPPDAVASGIGTYTEALACALAAKGHRIHVLSRGRDEDTVERTGSVTIYRLSPARFVFPPQVNFTAIAKLAAKDLTREWRYRKKLAEKLEELVEAENIDLVEAPDSAAEALFYQPRKHAAIPFLVRLHGPASVMDLFDKSIPETGRRLIRKMERRLILKATHLTAPSRAVERLCRQEMALGERPIAVFPNPPSVKFQESMPAAEEDPYLVLFVGRITPVKGVHLLVQAVPAVLKSCPQAKFVFVGPESPTGRQQRWTRDYLLTLLPSRYHHALEFTGYRAHAAVANYFQRAAVCVFPSLFDNFPYACLEAMNFGKAIVGSRNSGMSEMLDNGRYGLLYTPPDVSELSSHILRLLQDPALRLKLGSAARAWGLKRYQQDVVAAECETFYRQAISELQNKKASEPL